MASRIVFEALRLLIPRDVPGTGKIRIGGEGDGGYVLLDDLDPAQPVMSFGIGPSVAFDRDMAERGHDILMFDHTIDRLPGEHPKFTWHREGVAATAQPALALHTLAGHMAKLPQNGAEPILKMDVEGAEWEVLATVPPGLLARFTQITIEFHFLLDLRDPAFNATVQAALAAINQDFALVHVHGNNFGRLGTVGGFAMPETIEVTYARRSRYPTTLSATVYPTRHDSPNFNERTDFLLWFFPFMPGSHTLPPPPADDGLDMTWLDLADRRGSCDRPWMAHALTPSAPAILSNSALDSAAVQQARIDLAATFRMAHRLGMHEGICNHFSAMLPGSDSLFLVNPYGWAFAEITASRLLVCDFEGRVIAGEGVPEATAFFIHARVHKNQPRARVALHTHMPNATALAMLEGPPLAWAGQTALKFHGRLIVDDDYNGLALDEQEGDRIAASMGEADIVFMRNHGVMVVGPDIATAWDDLYYLERACEVQRLALSTGRKLKEVAPDVIARTAAQMRLGDGESARLHLESVKRILDREAPDYRA